MMERWIHAFSSNITVTTHNPSTVTEVIELDIPCDFLAMNRFFTQKVLDFVL